MPAIPGQCHLITCWRGQWPTRQRLWGRLGDTQGFRGSTQDFKHHCCLLLVPANEMRTAHSHALFLGLLPHMYPPICHCLHFVLFATTSAMNDAFIPLPCGAGVPMLGLGCATNSCKDLFLRPCFGRQSGCEMHRFVRWEPPLVDSSTYGCKAQRQSQRQSPTVAMGVGLPTARAAAHPPNHIPGTKGWRGRKRPR